MNTPKPIISVGEPPVIEIVNRYYGTNGIKFSNQDWFSRHEPFWDSIIPECQPQRILEIGSYEGRSTCFIAKSCAEFKPIELFCIDTWKGSPEHIGTDFKEIETRFDENMKLIMANCKFPVKLHKLKGYSFVELCRLALTLIDKREPLFDLIYIDGSHAAADVFYDAAISFQLLAVNGYLIFDDYRVLENPKTEYDIPTIAIDAFLRVYNNKLQTLRFQSDDEYIVKNHGGVIPETDIYQLYLKKISE